MSNFPTFRYFYSEGSGNSSTWADGELLIGNDGGVPAVSTLQAGSGIEITNSPGSITITNTQNNTVDGLQTETTATTSSGVDVVLDGTSFSPGNGNFLVIFSGTYTVDAKDKFIEVSMYKGAVQIPFSKRRGHVSLGGLQLELTCMAYVPGISGEVIEMRWHTEQTPSPATGTFFQRSIMAIRVS